MFCGDLLWKDHFPNLIDASTDKWIATLTTFQEKFGSYKLVPGHGGVASPEDVTAFKGYLTDLRAAVAKAQSDGKSGDALVEAVQPGLLSKYEKWGWSKSFARTNILQTADELAGKKRIPQAPPENHMY